MEQTSSPAAVDSDATPGRIPAAKHDELVDATRTMFSNVYEYFQSELAGSVHDLKLLEAMNSVSKEKYAEMTVVAKALTTFMDSLQSKYKEFEPYLRKIDEIDGNVAELERTVSLLDDYTKRLEERYKKLAAQKREVLRR